jgi:KaiC/GvpD/RAD55 family RecA-like ATPase
MLPELSIIKLFLEHKTWETYRDKLAVKDMPRELQPVYSLLDNYHNNNESKADLSVADLSNLLVASSVKDKDYYLGVLEQLQKLEVSADTTITLIRTIVRNKQLGEISLIAHDVKEGRMEVEKINNLIDRFRLETDTPTEEIKDIYVSDDIELIVNDVFKKPGLRWRLKTMNQMLGSLRFGDFGFIFARPETGKTTFIASELTYMAEQATDPVIWLANEEDGKKVMLRIYLATFGITLTELLTDLPGWKKKFHEKYQGRLKVVSDMSVMTDSGVKKMCDKLKPSLLVIDQLSKIGGFKDDRKDLELGTACEWGRTMAKTYCPTVAVHQADGTGEGVKWLGMNHVSNAKTAMQAEADWILGIGKIHDPGWESVRFLALSKNKLTGDEDTVPDQRHGKREIIIEPQMARYRDIQ